MDVAARAMTAWWGSAPAAPREADFAALVERQSRLMFRVAMTVARREDEAEEAVQEAFLRMFQGEGWRGATDERAYALRVVWRVAVDRARRRSRRREDLDVNELALPAHEESVDAELARKQERQRLHALIDGLPEELRQALLLCSLEEMSSREVGVLLGVPEGTVRTRVMRAKAELRRRWESADRRRGGMG